MILKKNISIFLIIIFSFTLLSCNKKIKKYKDLNEVLYENILKQEPNEYMIFVISNTCAACEELESLICKYANVAKTNNLPQIYCLNLSNNQSNSLIINEDDSAYGYFVGTTNYLDVKISQTPALLIVKDGKIDTFISSKVTSTPKNDIKEYIEKLIQ